MQAGLVSAGGTGIKAGLVCRRVAVGYASAHADWVGFAVVQAQFLTVMGKSSDSDATGSLGQSCAIFNMDLPPVFSIGSSSSSRRWAAWEGWVPMIEHRRGERRLLDSDASSSSGALTGSNASAQKLSANASAQQPSQSSPVCGAVAAVAMLQRVAICVLCIGLAFAVRSFIKSRVLPPSAQAPLHMSFCLLDRCV